MTAGDVMGLLRSENSELATAMTWVPAGTLRSLTWSSGVENEAEALQAVAASLGVDLAFVPGDEPWAPEALMRLAEAGIARGWIVSGVLGRVAEELGWSTVIRDSAGRPGDLAFALDEALHTALQEIRTGIAADAEVLMIADDLAGPSGWLVAPDFALEALLPCYHRMVSEWLPHGGLCVFHSDGDVRALMGSLRTAGFSGIHLALPRSTAFAQAVATARDAGLCALGGIEAQSMTAGNARRVGARIGSLTKHHAFIVADDGGMTTAEQVVAFGVALTEARAAAGG